MLSWAISIQSLGTACTVGMAFILLMGKLRLVDLDDFFCDGQLGFLPPEPGILCALYYMHGDPCVLINPGAGV